jgi:hypothetical protein
MTRQFARASFVISAFGFLRLFISQPADARHSSSESRMTPAAAVSARGYNYAGNTVESVTSLSTVC